MKRRIPLRSTAKLEQLDFLELLAAEATVQSIQYPASDAELFLPGLPATLIRECFAGAPGNEIEGGKFSHRESSAALAGNAFGLFLERPGDLPAIPHCERWWSAPISVNLETTLRFPWNQGRHPCVDVLVQTERAVFAIESKRFEPFREKPPSFFSAAYWRGVWGDRMDGYEFVRDILSGCGGLFSHLNAAQLVKHAFGLRTAIQLDPRWEKKKTPVLIYLYCEPTAWPDGRHIPESYIENHRREITRFAKCVADSEVEFVSLTYKTLLSTWDAAVTRDVRQHATAIKARFSI